MEALRGLVTGPGHPGKELQNQNWDTGDTRGKEKGLRRHPGSLTEAGPPWKAVERSYVRCCIIMFYHSAWKVAGVRTWRLSW